MNELYHARWVPASLRPATRLARVGSNQLTELIVLVLNTSDGLDLAQEI